MQLDGAVAFADCRPGLHGRADERLGAGPPQGRRERREWGSPCKRRWHALVPAGGSRGPAAAPCAWPTRSCWSPPRSCRRVSAMPASAVRKRAGAEAAAGL